MFSKGQTPADVDSVSVIHRTETELTLQWNKVDNNNSYSYVLKHSNETEDEIPATGVDPVLTHTISSLSAGTKYSFTLYTKFEGMRSSGYNFSNVTGK